MDETSSRYLQYSIQESNEALSPSEKILRRGFLSKENTNVLIDVVHRNINPSETDGNVVDAMHETFERSLYLDPDTISELNNIFIKNFKATHDASVNAMTRSRERSFTRSNIPTNFLPRASFSVQEDSHDKILEFSRRMN